MTKSIYQATSIIIISIVVGFLYNSLYEQGFIKNNKGVKAVIRANLSAFIPEIDRGRAKILLEKKEAVFVDARFEKDYVQGHIPGAMNISIASDTERQRESLAHVSYDTEIVVYCQSSQCSYAQKMAIRLKDDGYVNVCVYREGWDSWVSPDYYSNLNKPN